jgi:hypothetical protein
MQTGLAASPRSWSPFWQRARRNHFLGFRFVSLCVRDVNSILKIMSFTKPLTKTVWQHRDAP